MSNRTILDEYTRSKTASRFSPGLAQAFVTLVDSLIRRPNFRGYTFRDDMKSEALEHLCRGWASFDPTRTTNAFGYYTRVAWAAFVRVINAEKKAGRIRDELLAARGFQGSLGFELEQKNIDPHIFRRFWPFRQF